jgi:hypothetical protein
VSLALGTWWYLQAPTRSSSSSSSSILTPPQLWCCRSRYEDAAGAVAGNCRAQHSAVSDVGDDTQPAVISAAEAAQQPSRWQHTAGDSKRYMDQGHYCAEELC